MKKHEFETSYPIGSNINEFVIKSKPYYCKKSKGVYVVCQCSCGNIVRKDICVIKNIQGCYKCKGKRCVRPNNIIIENDIANIYVKDNRIMFSIADVPIISKYRWGLTPTGKQRTLRVTTTINRKRFNAPNIIFDSKKIYDHIDGNTLNNQRNNLRECTLQQNIFNSKKHYDAITSKYIGVYFNKKQKLWVARIRSKTIGVQWIKYFKIELEAAMARDQKAKEIYGEFAKLNFPDTKH